MKRTLIIVVCIALAIAASAWWWQAGRIMDRVATFLPPMPGLASAPPALRERIAAADARAHSRARAGRGLVELGRLYHANGFLDEAQRCYRGLQQLYPREPRWPHLHATILAGYGDIAAALPLSRRVVELAPDYIPARLRLGDSLLKTNRTAEAAAAYEQVVQRERDNPYARLGLARLDLEAGRLEAARQRLEQLVNQTNYTLGYDLIVSLYERLGLTERANAVRAQSKASGAYRDPPDPWLDALLDDCYDPYRLSLAAGTTAGSGNIAQGRLLLERALAIAPDDLSVRFQLGTMLVRQGDLAAARGELEHCTVLAPDFADAWAHLSALLAQQGRVTDANRILAEGLKNCPLSPGLHLMLARNHQQAGRLGEAIGEFQRSIELRPNEADAYLELGQLFIRADRVAEGVEEMRRALAAEPGNPVALGVLAINAINTGSETEARAWLGRVRQQPRIDGDQVRRLAMAYQKRFGSAP